jgi:hypothetical protein
MPEELSKLIQDFARPVTRTNWRKGGAFRSSLFYLGLLVDRRLHPIFHRADFDWLVHQAMYVQTAEEFEQLNAVQLY